MKDDIKYFKVYYPIGGWEWYRKIPYECHFYSSGGFWHACGEPDKERQVEVSKLEMLILFGREAVSEVL